MSTRISKANAATSSHDDQRRIDCGRTRRPIHMAIKPTTTITPWRTTRDQGESSCSADTAMELENTMTMPRPLRMNTTPRITT